MLLLARVQLHACTLAGTRRIEEAAEEGAQEEEIPARYAEADFEVGPDPCLDLGDCGDCYSGS